MHLKNVESVLVSNVGGANTGTSLATIVAGDVLVLNKNNTNLTGTPTLTSAVGNDAIRIALGLPAGLPDSDRRFRISSDIIGKNVKSWKKAVYSAPVQDVVTLGNLALAVSTEYRLRIVVKDRHRFKPNGQTSMDYYYKTGASVSQIDAALSFAKKINADNARLRNTIVATVTAGAGTITEASANGTVTNGSKTVTSTGHGLTVGEYVSIRDVIYKVALVIDANTFEIDRPYTGVSETIAVASTVDQFGDIATPTQINIVLTGVAISTKSVDLYQKLSFTANLAPVNGEAGDETPVAVVSGTPGSGYWEQVRDMEFFEAGRRGITNRTQFPIDDFKPIAQAGATYTLLIIEHYEDNNVVDHVVRNPIETIIAFDISSASTKLNAIEAILDSWMASAGVAAV